MFQQPGQGDKITISELVGSLVLIWVHGIREDIPTTYGPKEAINCDVHILDGPKGGERFQDVLIFQAALIGSLRGAINTTEPVLGRISTGLAKPGQNPPFTLSPYTTQDAELATGYLQRMPKPFQAPTPVGPTTTAPTATPAPTATAPAAPGNPGYDLTHLPPEVQALISASLTK